MECVLLGTGGMMPLPHRYLASLAVRHRGKLFVFDAGEGAQIALKRAKLGIKSLGVLAISHLHGDHCLGAPGMMMMRAQLPDPGPLTILGPPGTERFLTRVRESTGHYLNYAVRFVEWREQASRVAYEDEVVRILWEPLKHTAFCLGYRLEEHPRPGRFRPSAARALGIPEGPLWGKLQRGETVEAADGTPIRPERVLGPPRAGRSVAYAVDSRPCKGLYHLCREADIAFLDGMFLPEHGSEAEAKGHMTVDDAARVASRAGTKRAVLIHISPRYGPDDLDLLSEAAGRRFAGAEIGVDLRVYPVPQTE